LVRHFHTGWEHPKAGDSTNQQKKGELGLATNQSSLIVAVEFLSDLYKAMDVDDRGGLFF
jgi:hypothetical protein